MWIDKRILIFALLIVVVSCSTNEIENFPKDDETAVLEFTGITDKVVVLNDTFGETEIVVAGNAIDLFIVSFKRKLNQDVLQFRQTDSSLPIIMEDNEGNEWDIFGKCVSGARKDQQLESIHSVMGYWFSIGTFFPGAEIYLNNDKSDFLGEVIRGTGDWLIPHKEIFSGGVGKDGIPAISNPQFSTSNTYHLLFDDDLVLGIQVDNLLKAYPHPVLDWHEIVNDELSDTKYSIVYCPLTGTGTAWNREINGTVTSFGVSGFLYNSNILPYDRLTGSNWSQLVDRAVEGNLQGKVPEKIMLVETKWETWKKMYPHSEVQNFNTGYNRSYKMYPYGTYRRKEELLFPVKYNDERLPSKERVHAVIIEERARVYRFSDFYTEK